MNDSEAIQRFQTARNIAHIERDGKMYSLQPKMRIHQHACASAVAAASFNIRLFAESRMQDRQTI